MPGYFGTAVTTTSDRQCTICSHKLTTSRWLLLSSVGRRGRHRRQFAQLAVDPFEERLAVVLCGVVDVVHRQPGRSGEAVAQDAHCPADDPSSRLAFQHVEQLR